MKYVIRRTWSFYFLLYFCIPVGLLAFAIGSTLLGLMFAGALDPFPVGDSGPVVRSLLPIWKTLYTLCSSVVLGALVLCVLCSRIGSPEYNRFAGIAHIASVVWVPVILVCIMLTYLDISSVQLSIGPSFTSGLLLFLQDIELGRLWFMNLVLVALLSVFLGVARAKLWMLGCLALGFLALWPRAISAHSSGAQSHDSAFGALVLHYSAVAVWVGCVILLAVALWRKWNGVDASFKYFSNIALCAYICVGFSGVAISIINVGNPADLFTHRYGLLLLLKIVLFVVLGAIGAILRKYFLHSCQNPRMLYVLLLEIAIMMVVIGVSTALARSQPPIPQITAADFANPSPARILSGVEHPPILTLESMWNIWSIENITLFIGLFSFGAYLVGYIRLRRKGHSWHFMRLVSFGIAVLIFIYVTSGFVFVYGKFMFSFHMLQHMVLSMIVPIFVVLSAPVSLLYRVCKPRKDGSMGVREWLKYISNLRIIKIISHPIVSGIHFASALVVFYFTPYFYWATWDHVGHLVMIFDFSIVGYLFISSLIGKDPLHKRVMYFMRLISLILVMTFHAFFGLAIMTSNSLLVADWYGATGRNWGPATAIDDQKIGGAIAWGIGEFPTAILALVIAVRWSRADLRSGAFGRKGPVDPSRQDSDGYSREDKMLDEYNKKLQALARKKR